MTETLTAAPTDTAVPHAALWDRWIRLWNGADDPAERTIADSVVLHLPKTGMPPAASLRTPAAVVAWIGMFRSSYSGAVLATEHGPLAATDSHGGSYLVGRWVFRGVWQGGRPATATAPHGTAVEFRGTDVLRVVDDRIVEYWLSDDLLDVYAALGADPGETTGTGPARPTTEGR